MLSNPSDWIHHAKCRELGTARNARRRDLLFPTARGGPEIAAAKRYCAGCPVAAACLADGDDDTHSVRAGLTADERRRLREGAPVSRCAGCRLPFVARPANPARCTGCTGRYDNPVGPEDFKDAIIAMHLRGCSGEQLCLHFGFSRDEIRLAGKRWRLPLMRRPVAECGTPAGASRHRRRGERACRRCQAADTLRLAQRRLAAAA